MHLILFLLRMPWFVYLGLGAGLIYASTLPTFKNEDRIAQIQAAMEAEAPLPIAIGNYARPDQKFTEATLRVQIVSDETTRLIDRTNGVKTGEDVLLVLADPTATEGLRTFPGLMILTKQEFDVSMDWFLERTVGVGELGPIVEINGSVSGYDGEASHAKDALESRGGRAARDVIYITPFWGDREGELQALLESAESTDSTVLYLGLGVIGFGLLKLGFNVALRPRRRKNQINPA